MKSNFFTIFVIFSTLAAIYSNTTMLITVDLKSVDANYGLTTINYNAL